MVSRSYASEWRPHSWTTIGSFLSNSDIDLRISPRTTRKSQPSSSYSLPIAKIRIRDQAK